MKLSKLLIICFFSLPPSLSAQSNERDPIIIEFGNKSNFSPEEDRVSCWDDLGQFLSNECKTLRQACEISQTYKNPVTFDLAIKYERDFYVYRSDGKRSYTIDNSPEGGMAKYDAVPKGTRIIRYEETRDNTFVISQDFYVHSTEFPTAKKRYPIKKFTFIADPELLKEKKHIGGSFLYSQLGTLDVNQNVSLSVPGGEYQVEFNYTEKDAVYQSVFEVSVKENDIAEEKIIVKSSHFQKKKMKDGYYSTFQGGRIQIYPKPSTQKDNKFGFEILPKIEIAETEKDVTNFYQLIRGHVVLRPEKVQELNMLIEQFPFVTLNIKGDCTTFYNYKTLQEHPLYKTSDQKIYLGKLILLKDQDGLNFKFQAHGQNELSKFIPSIHNGVCNEYTTRFIHQAKEISHELTNLGKGPWGSDAWIKGFTPYHLFSSTEKNWEYDENAWVRYKKVNGKIKAIGKKSKSNEYGGVEYENVEYDVKETEIIDSNGKLKIKLNCWLGC